MLFVWMTQHVHMDQCGNAKMKVLRMLNVLSMKTSQRVQWIYSTYKSEWKDFAKAVKVKMLLDSQHILSSFIDSRQVSRFIPRCNTKPFRF